MWDVYVYTLKLEIGAKGYASGCISNMRYFELAELRILELDLLGNSKTIRWNWILFDSINDADAVQRVHFSKSEGCLFVSHELFHWDWWSDNKLFAVGAF